MSNKFQRHKQSPTVEQTTHVQTSEKMSTSFAPFMQSLGAHSNCRNTVFQKQMTKSLRRRKKTDDFQKQLTNFPHQNKPRMRRRCAPPLHYFCVPKSFERKKTLCQTTNNNRNHSVSFPSKRHPLSAAFTAAPLAVGGAVGRRGRRGTHTFRALEILPPSRYHQPVFVHRCNYDCYALVMTSNTS